jgi:hypothetical protein
LALLVPVNPERFSIQNGGSSSRVCLVPHFTQKKFGCWPIILQNRTKHHAKFLAKRYPFSILDFGHKRPKKKSQKALTHPMKNLAFWMELNTPMKILAFCISSFQSSWHFAFHEELNTA